MREMSECSGEEKKLWGDSVGHWMYTWLSNTSHCSPRCRRSTPPRIGRGSGTSSVRASDALDLAHATPDAAGRENVQRRFPRAPRQAGEAGGVSCTFQVLVRRRLRRIDFRGGADFALYDEWVGKKGELWTGQDCLDMQWIGVDGCLIR